MELDIRKLVDVISHSDNRFIRGLVDFATGASVESEITQDLLHARTTGEKDFENNEQYYFFKNPSIKFQKKEKKATYIQHNTKETQAVSIKAGTKKLSLH